MQIETVTNILSSAHESLADFKSSACLENFTKQRRHIRGSEKARFATPLAGMYTVNVDLTVGGAILSGGFHPRSASLLTTLFTVNVLEMVSEGGT